MSYGEVAISNFKKKARRLVKRFPSLKEELITLDNTLQNNPTHDTRLAKNCYKIRLAIASKNKGRGGGARVITHIHVAGNTVFLLSIYDKSEREDLDDNEIND